MNSTTLQRNTERKSNFELARIVAMIMIVANHLVGHGIQHVSDANSAYQLWQTGSPINRLFASFFLPGGGVGVAIFFMITGYFLLLQFLLIY